MIKTISIRGFLSHKQSKLNLDKGVNVIVGESKAGKSAIIQALRWLIFNRPTGDSYRSFYTDATRVSVTTDEGIRVQRMKSDKMNEYRLNGKEPYRAFGTDVPDDVVKTLNMDSLNISTQFEPHFLISKSPGEVAQYFNTVAHLDQIDTGLKNISKWIKQIQADIDSDKKQKERLQEDLKQYEDLDTIESKVELLEKNQKKSEEIDGSIESIGETIESIEEIDESIEERSKLLDAESKVDEIIQLRQKREDITDEIGQITELSQEIGKIVREIEEKENAISVESKVDELLGYIEKRNELQSKADGLQAINVDIDDIDMKIAEKNKKLKQAEQKWHEEAPETCPLCAGSGKLKEGSL